MLCETIQRGDFENIEIPLQMFSSAIDIFFEHHETPLKAVQLFTNDSEKNNLSVSQKLFVYKWVNKYLKYTEYDEADMTEINEILISHAEQLKKDKPEHNKPLVGNIREILKDMIKKELDQLPGTLKEIEPIQKLNVLCKLIPYVLPRVEAVHSEKGEHEQENNISFPDYNW